jgi:triosephosphate isomerase (TIM)
MITPLIIANFKSHMNLSEASEWISKMRSFNNKTVIVLPPFTLLSFFKAQIQAKKLNLSLGSQNMSPFDEGAFTGEINARQVKEFCDYVLIGHSERRKNFSEDDEFLGKKIALALENNLKPIFCVQGKETNVPKGVEIIAYEPIFAIGTGNPDTPGNAGSVALAIKANRSDLVVLYGGSVKSTNVRSFTEEPNIDGVLVGGASLDPQEFSQIIENA